MTAPSRDCSRVPLIAGRLILCACLMGAASVALLRGWLPCPFAALFGVPCPGCGLTRGTLRLLRGDLSGAMSEHPLVPLLLPVLAVVGGSEIAGHVWRAPLAWVPRARGSAGLVLSTALLALLVLVWVLRFCGGFGGPALIGGVESPDPRRAVVTP